MKKRKVLLLGLFLKNKDQKNSIRTVEDRMAEMFSEVNMSTIVSSSSRNRFSRWVDTIYTVIRKRSEYNIAVVPLFGTWPSFLWQECVTRLLKVLRKKIILVIHGGSIPDRINNGATRFSRALKRADVLIAPSAYFRDYFCRKGFKITIIENPINLSDYLFHYKEVIRPRIVWMRAFSEVYNPAMALRVAKRMADRYPDFKMVMAGKSGPLADPIKRAAAEYGLCGKIVFPGYITLPEKQRLSDAYDIYICTNKVDNAPVSLIEFMQLGLPVISVNAGGISHLIKDGENGLLVNQDDDEAMYRQIRRLIEDPALAKRIIGNARQYAMQFDTKSVIAKWVNVIGQLDGGNIVKPVTGTEDTD